MTQCASSFGVTLCELEARERAQSAVRALSKDLDLKAVTAASAIRDRLAPFEVPEERIYRAIATAAGFELAREVHAMRQGYDHRLVFLRHSAHIGETGASGTLRTLLSHAVL